jgi:hypothetical protein
MDVAGSRRRWPRDRSRSRLPRVVVGRSASQFGLILDIIGFVAFLAFVLVSSVTFLMREMRTLDAGGTRA